MANEIKRIGNRSFPVASIIDQVKEHDWEKHPHMNVQMVSLEEEEGFALISRPLSVEHKEAFLEERLLDEKVANRVRGLKLVFEYE